PFPTVEPGSGSGGRGPFDSPGSGLRGLASAPAMTVSPETLGRALADAPDPHLARLQLSRVGERPQAREELERPGMLPVAARLLGYSTAAGDFLVAHPEEASALEDVRRRQRDELDAELAADVERLRGRGAGLRRFRRRAMLRVAARDLLAAPLEDVVA